MLAEKQFVFKNVLYAKQVNMCKKMIHLCKVKTACIEY